jgi:hypothetical protein
MNDEKHGNTQWRKMGKDVLGDLGVDGSVTLQRVLTKFCVRT